MTQQSRKARTATWALVLLIVTAMLYLMSGPPLFILAMRGFLSPKGSETARTYLRPFVWVRDHSPLRGALETYSTWCWRMAGDDFYPKKGPGPFPPDPFAPAGLQE